MSNKRGYPDKPVAKIKDDLFSVSTYVNGLSSFVSSCDTPMTISIQGDWGSGKTSMMNMIKENTQASVFPIWFNTWQFSQFNMGNSLVFSMMDVLLESLDCDQDSISKVLNGLAGVAKTVARAAAGQLGGDVAEEIVSDAMNARASSDYAREVLELKKKFQDAVNKKLEKMHRDRVVVFVDDLDRLQPIKAIELLEVLKLFFDCDKCVFILAVDYEVVTLGIREKFGANVSEEKGKRFFDKIIQLPFKMPIAQYDIKEYVSDMMKKMSIRAEEKEIKLFTKLIKSSVGFNPRSMKRLFNVYQLLDIITETTVKGIDETVRKRILFAIVCAQMCFEEFYVYMTSTELEAEDFESLKNREEDNKIYEEIYSDCAKEEIEEKSYKLSQFIGNFIEAIQCDGDESLSEKELENLQGMLKCSVVTSIAAGVEESSDEVWKYRNRNKELVKKIAVYLKDIGEFKTWMPRKAREGVNLYDISGYYQWSELGFKIRLEYYLSRIDRCRICCHIYISLCDGKGQEDAFFQTFGENPLTLEMKPIKEECGSYKYLNVISRNDTDKDLARQVADITRSAYDKLKDILSKAAKEAKEAKEAEENRD